MSPRSWMRCTTRSAMTLVALAVASPARGDDGSSTQAPASWATAQAIDRTRMGRAHLASGEPEAALRCFIEGIGFDGTYGPAYVALGALYEARGDYGEAERTFSLGIDHVVGFFDALWERARLRERRGRFSDAIGDLEAAASLRPEAHVVLRELAGAYVADHAIPAALATARRWLRLAEATGDTGAAIEARLEVRALQGIVGELDPVSAGAHGRGPVRRAVWAIDQARPLDRVKRSAAK